MIAHAIDTVRRAVRGPSLWVLTGLGLVAGWSAAGLAILALGRGHAQAAGIVGETSRAFAVLVVLFVLARTLEQDRRSQLTTALDATRPGRVGRLAGRWGGAALVGLSVSAFLHACLGLTAGLEAAEWLYLYSTSIVVVLLGAGWGLLLAGAFHGGGVVLAGLLAWFLGHLPWGTAGLLEGPTGRALAALLPGPRTTIGAPSALAAAVGLLLLALALQGRPTPRI
jgi:hypothetical protein